MAGGYGTEIGRWIRNVLPKTKACAYFSATAIKTPAVMPLYSKKTSLGETGMTDERLYNAMEKGGLALQEIIASDLAASGQLIRRQRSNEGVQVDYKVLDKEPRRSLIRKKIDHVVDLMQKIIEFEEEFVMPIQAEIHAQARKEGEKMKFKPRNLGVRAFPYFSKIFNVIDQIMFSLKVEDVAQEAIKLLEKNEKVVIAFRSTMGSFLKDLNLSGGDIIHPAQLDFGRTLLRGLDQVFNYSYTDIGGNKSRRQIELSTLPLIAMQKYRELRERIQFETTDISPSPIDDLLQLIESTPKPSHLGGHSGSHFKVGEVTGRTQRIVREGEDSVVKSFRSKPEKFFRFFNEGKFDVLLINQSGSTGFSAHASEKFKDQRRRNMIVHQFGLDINIVVQIRGRVNRSGQIVKPRYLNLSLDYPQENRLIAMTKHKLKSLDANTTGSQKTSDESLQGLDYLNKYGDAVARNWIIENPELVERMGRPGYSRTYDKDRQKMVYTKSISDHGLMKQLTGRAALLHSDEQDNMYTELITRYLSMVRYEKQRGTYNLEVEFLKLDAEVSKRFMHKVGNGGSTPFGKDTIREVAIVNNLSQPYTRKEIDERISDKLKGRKRAIVQREFIGDLKDSFPKLIEDRRSLRAEVIEELEKEIESMGEAPEGADESELALWEKRVNDIKEIVTTKKKELEHAIKQLERLSDRIVQCASWWQIGDVVFVPLAGKFEPVLGVFLGIHLGSGKNPYAPSNIIFRFAVSDSRKLLEFNIAPEQYKELVLIRSESEKIEDGHIKQATQGWNDMVRESSMSRERRHILVQNVVSVSDMVSQTRRLIKYNTKSGAVRNGILLEREYEDSSGAKSTILPISKSYSELAVLEINKLFSDEQNRIRFMRITEDEFRVSIKKPGNKEIYTDEVLRALLKRPDGQSTDELPDFVQNAGDMVGQIQVKVLSDFLRRLDAFGLTYTTRAKEAEDWEKENEQEWEDKTKKGEPTWYKLQRPFGNGTHPVESFLAYEEPNGDFKYGRVSYSRKLTDRERYNYSLIPLFENVRVPFEAWKSYIKATPLQRDLEELIEELQQTDQEEASIQLGYFITGHPHENGNTEFVFGEYDEMALGSAAFEEFFERRVTLSLVIRQLEIELAKAA